MSMPEAEQPDESRANETRSLYTASESDVKLLPSARAHATEQHRA